MASAVDTCEMTEISDLEKYSLFVYTWKIEDFSLWPGDHSIQSRDFNFLFQSGNKYYEIDWNVRVQLCSNGDVKSVLDDNLVSKQIIIDDTVYALLILNSVADETKYFTSCTIGNWAPLASKAELLNSKEVYLPKNTLTLSILFFGNMSIRDIIEKSEKIPNIPNEACHIVTTCEVEKFSIVSKLLHPKRKKPCLSCSSSGFTAQSISIYTNDDEVERAGFKVNFEIDEVAKGLDHAKIIITMSKDSVSESNVNLTLQVKVMSSKEVLSKEGSYHFKIAADTWSFPPFIQVNDLQPGKLLTSEGVLVLKFDFECMFMDTAKDVIRHKHTSFKDYTFQEIHTSCLSRQLVDKLTDVELICGAEKFLVHKLVLMVRSPVFHRMFEDPMKESIESKLHITEVEPKIMRYFINYLYTDTLDRTDLNINTILELYKTAHCYDVDSLMVICRIMLLDELSDQNFCDIVKLAYVYDDDHLKESLLNYLRYQSTDVFGLPEWSALASENTDMAAEVMLNFLAKSNKKILSGKKNTHKVK